MLLAALLLTCGSLAFPCPAQSVPKVRFLIMFAGGKCKDPQYEPLYQEAAAGDHIPTPAVVVIGQAVRGSGSMGWYQGNTDRIMPVCTIGSCQMAWAARPSALF